MKTLISLVILSIFSCASSYAQKSFANQTSQLLKNREPNVRWNLRSFLKADFDYDGIDDYALTGRKNNFLIIGIVKATVNDKSKYWMLEFSEDASSQDGLCSVSNARISAEKFSNDEIPDLRKLPSKSRGINLSDDACDAFHIYYNRKEQRFVWWRN